MNRHLIWIAIAFVTAGCVVKIAELSEGAGSEVTVTDAGADVDQVDDAEASADATLGCGAGKKLCHDVCVDETNPEFGCKASACSPCDVPGAIAACVATECTVGACQPGYGDCTSEPGCETPTASDPAHCGDCSASCQTGEVCDQGHCQSSCTSPGLTNCDGACVDLSEDPAHCGTCDQVCPATPNAQPSCVANGCTPDCLPGFGNCDGLPANGCETLLLSNESHCGTCNTACAIPDPGAPGQSCAGGGCQCPLGLEACDSKNCVDSQSDPLFCGCAMCPGGQYCTNATCKPLPCAFGLKLCGATCVNISNDAANCGGCGKACAATEHCLARACVESNCNNKCPDGTCTSLSTDPANCGVCDKVCAPGERCRAGSCMSLKLAGAGWECSLLGLAACPMPPTWQPSAPFACVPVGQPCPGAE